MSCQKGWGSRSARVTVEMLNLVPLFSSQRQIARELIRFDASKMKGNSWLISPRCAENSSFSLESRTSFAPNSLIGFIIVCLFFIHRLQPPATFLTQMTQKTQ